MEYLYNQDFDCLSGRAFRSLYEDTTMSDVTLVSEDKIMFQAHKVIIATASIVIRELITNNTGPDHFVHFGVSSRILQDILKFIYTGKCTVPKTHLDQFFKEAKIMQIQGIDAQKTLYPKKESLNSDETNKHKQDKNETCQQENAFYELSEGDTNSPIQTKHEGKLFFCDDCENLTIQRWA